MFYPYDNYPLKTLYTSSCVQFDCEYTSMLQDVSPYTLKPCVILIFLRNACYMLIAETYTITNNIYIDKGNRPRSPMNPMLFPYISTDYSKYSTKIIVAVSI